MNTFPVRNKLLFFFFHANYFISPNEKQEERRIKTHAISEKKNLLS